MFKTTAGSILVILSFALFTSCLSRKKVDYFQVEEGDKRDSVKLMEVFEPRIQSNDILNIQVASINPEAARFFNPTDETGTGTDAKLTSYLVDLNGEIEMPLIGRVKVAGLTTREVRDTLRHRLEKYLESPTVKLSYETFKITLLGEVKTPGLYQVTAEKISLPEALGLAGDLTIYGDRTKVMVIREVNGSKVFHETDLTGRDVFASEMFYLHPGDVVYVPAGKGRIASADAFYRIAPLVISTLTLITLIFYRFGSNN